MMEELAGMTMTDVFKRSKVRKKKSWKQDDDLELDICNIENLPAALTIREVAALLRIGRNSAYDLVNSGTLKSVRVGHQIRVSRAELYRYLGFVG